MLGRPDGVGVPRSGAGLVRAADSIGVVRNETLNFARLQWLPPREIPFDLCTKALLAAAFVCLSIYGLRTRLVDATNRAEYGVIAALAGARLLWLARASRRRGTGVTWLALPTAIVLVVGVIASPFRELSETFLPRNTALLTRSASATTFGAPTCAGATYRSSICTART